MLYSYNYREFDNSYRTAYIRNNKSIKSENVSTEELFNYVKSDVDIIFRSLCLSPAKKGYIYWRDAIFICLNDRSYPKTLCNMIYGAISEKYDKSVVSIERAMRYYFEESLYGISKNGSDFITDHFSKFLIIPKNSKILICMVDFITSKKFQDMKDKL